MVVELVIRASATAVGAAVVSSGAVSGAWIVVVPMVATAVGAAVWLVGAVSGAGLVRKAPTGDIKRHRI